MLVRVHDGRLLLDVLAVRDDEVDELAVAVATALVPELADAARGRAGLTPRRPTPRDGGRPRRERRAGPPLTLGTAGHIDHGKTALVTLLTGKNTDRLREERERGISIELGYAELELPGGRRLSVVDVPGHERFVRTMVAGATGIDLFLLVVAADDGVMPQTVEHLAIIELLGVPRGVVALTKADLVDEELLELARDDVRRASSPARRTRARASSTVSARDGRGMPELLGALERGGGAARAAGAEGAARLAVDRGVHPQGHRHGGHRHAVARAETRRRPRWRGARAARR